MTVRVNQVSLKRSAGFLNTLFGVPNLFLNCEQLDFTESEKKDAICVHNLIIKHHINHDNPTLIHFCPPLSSFGETSHAWKFYKGPILIRYI